MVDFDLVNVAINGAFGESLLYQPGSGAPAFTIQGVFTDAYKRAYEGADGKPGWTTTAPSVGVRSADFPVPPAKDDRLTRLSTGEVFLVFDARADGVGWLNVPLKVAA